MRRAITSLLAAAALVASLGASLGVAAPASAAGQECEGYGCAHRNYERTRHLPAYGSRYDGYWDRPGERRRHHRRYRDYRGYSSGVHYYPGYGYYPDRPGYGRDDGYRDGSYRDGGYRDSADDCAARFRSYDRRSGTYVGYDGYRHRCG